MATLNSKTLFVATSPRSPEKMIPELALLADNFSGKKWDKDTQAKFMEMLAAENFYEGSAANDPSFSARDRINRAPKAYGFIKLTPTIELTNAGKELIEAQSTSEIFLRQLLKFQLPSPYHKIGTDSAKFRVKPFLELLRLIRTIGEIRFDELQIFGLQLTDYKKFDKVLGQIGEFRVKCATTDLPYSKFKRKVLENEIKRIYSSEIKTGLTKTRETNDRSTDAFIATKARNMRDYADAFVRYLRATGVVAVSSVGRSLSIAPHAVKDVDYILAHADRVPKRCNEAAYVRYIGDSTLPHLLTDNKEDIIEKIKTLFPEANVYESHSLPSLKKQLEGLMMDRKKGIIAKEAKELKTYAKHKEVIDSLKAILTQRNLYDAPVLLEWNVWRAMTMLNGGEINSNMIFDDLGNPMSTAQGNVSDIVCNYGDFFVSVEVTMSSGQRQYEMEGESVSRHLGQLKSQCDKPAFGLFIAPKINDFVIAHFYALHKINISVYGGFSNILPLPLSCFINMVEASCNATRRPTPDNVRRFFEYSSSLAKSALNEKDWYDGVLAASEHWLNRSSV